MDENSGSVLSDSQQRTGISSDEKLKNTVISDDQQLDFRFGRYLSGKTVPSVMIRNFVHQYPPVAKSHYVFEIGPEEENEFVPLWMLFEDRCEEFWPVIENVISLYGRDDSSAHLSRIDRIAEVFLPRCVWTDIKRSTDGSVKHGNCLMESMQTGYFVPKLRFLAAVIAMWRLSMFVRDGVASMEFLLRNLLAGPYKKVLIDHGIYSQVCMLVRAYAVKHHAFEGNMNAATQSFAGLDLDVI